MTCFVTTMINLLCKSAPHNNLDALSISTSGQKSIAPHNVAESIATLSYLQTMIVALCRSLFAPLTKF